MPGKLYLVATPIGNLQDITFRALDVLRNVNVIACEDTRHTQKLLNHFRISNRTISYHAHNEHERADQLVDRIKTGESVALVSDAGTPGVNDPGVILVNRAIENGIEVIGVPGAVAFITALVSSGLSTESIYFGGFLPSKKGERRRRLDEVRGILATLVFYETPHRIAKSLADCAEILGDRRACVARELTKLHEEISRGTLNELAEKFADKKIKGEFVVIVDRPTFTGFARADADAKALWDRILALKNDGLNEKAALKLAAKEYGLSKSEAYRITKIRDETRTRTIRR
jgi:16S rRNA (cytidine1402-2'-O)-methyltransferase